jgi:hypothetical protein
MARQLRTSNHNGLKRAPPINLQSKWSASLLHAILKLSNPFGLLGGSQFGLIGSSSFQPASTLSVC